MTPKGNLLAAFKGDKTERIPWTALVGSVNTPSFAPEAIRRSHDELEVGCWMHEEFGCDVLVYGHPVRKICRKASVDPRVEGDRRIVEMRIGDRVLRKEEQFFDYDGQVTSSIKRYPVQSKEDLETLLALLDDQVLECEPGRYAERVEGIGERGVVAAYCPRTPLMELIIEYMDLQHAILALMDKPELMERAMDMMHRRNLEHFRKAIEADVDVVQANDDFSSLLISPSLFRDHCVPRLKEYAEIAHAAGKPFINHSCGHMREFLVDYAETGVAAHHYLTEPPVGNTPLQEAMEAWDGRISIMAAVDPVALETASVDEIRRSVASMLERAGHSRGFTLMTSSKPAVTEENLRAVQQPLEDYNG